MKSKEDLSVTTSCTLCEKLIYLEDGPVHTGCMLAREKKLLDVIQSLQDEVNVMRESFSNIDGILKSLKQSRGEEVATSGVVSKALQPRLTRSQTKKLNTDLRLRSVFVPAAENLSLPISPLSLPNATSSSQVVPVVQFNKKKTSMSSTSTAFPLSTSATHVTPPTFAAVASSTTNATSRSSTSTELSTDVPALHFVPPNKSVFVSGVSPSTTVEDLKSFIDFKAKYNTNVSIRKMNFNDERPYASFVVNVGRDSKAFKEINDHAFWPPNAIVREFDPFLRKRNHQTVQLSPKNGIASPHSIGM